MLTLFSYPDLYGVADNNPYGLKVFAFMKLAGLPFRHEHIFDASNAPRGQLPFLQDDEEAIGDSDAIIDHLTRRHAVTLDATLTPGQRDTHLMVRRTLDDLYWVMSYSRWKDPGFWPVFRDAILRRHPAVTPAAMEKAREYNFQRYHHQGIGRYEPAAAYARGIADLEALANLLPEAGYLFGANAGSIDAALYGFIANICFYEIDTPLKRCVLSRPHLVTHCHAIHARVTA